MSGRTFAEIQGPPPVAQMVIINNKMTLKIAIIVLK